MQFVLEIWICMNACFYIENVLLCRTSTFYQKFQEWIRMLLGNKCKKYLNQLTAHCNSSSLWVVTIEKKHKPFDQMHPYDDRNQAIYHDYCGQNDQTYQVFSSATHMLLNCSVTSLKAVQNSGSTSSQSVFRLKKLNLNEMLQTAPHTVLLKLVGHDRTRPPPKQCMICPKVI